MFCMSRNVKYSFLYVYDDKCNKRSLNSVVLDRVRGRRRRGIGELVVWYVRVGSRTIAAAS